MNALRKALTFTLNWPVYWVSRLTPRSKNVWVFGAWFGDRYTDNSRHLFEFVAAHVDDVQPVWLTRSAEIRDSLREAGYRAEVASSMRGYLVSMRAAAAFLVSSRWDVNRFCYVPHVFNLWHGIPLKRIMADDELHWREPSPLIRTVLPYYGQSPGGDLFVSSLVERAIMARSFRTPEARVHVTGAPRNDSLKYQKRISDKTVVLYAPTHRQEGALGSLGGLNAVLHSVDKAFREANALLVVRAHYYQNESLNLSTCDSIVRYEDLSLDPDVNTGLQAVDILVTDYSSIYFDFLLTGRPIVFFPYDLEQYLTADRGMNFAYDSVTPGPVCRSWDDVCLAVSSLAAGRDDYASARNAMRNRFHEHQDFRACARVVAIAKRATQD